MLASYLRHLDMGNGVCIGCYSAIGWLHVESSWFMA